MTRSRSGRAPGSDPGPGRGGRRHSDGRARKRPEGSESTSRRVTVPDETARGGRRRSRWVQVAAIVFVVLLVVSMSLGCARYDGDQAAFCDQLDEVPSFAKLALVTAAGTDAEARGTMAEAADDFRGLERLAPRSIRHHVAALGDAAQRIEAELDPDRVAVEPWATSWSGGAPSQPGTQHRFVVFYDEMQNHRGTVEAVYSLQRYASADCGFTEDDLDLGLFGYGNGYGYSDPYSYGFDGPVGGYGPPQVDPAPAPTPTPTPAPAPTPAPGPTSP